MPEYRKTDVEYSRLLESESNSDDVSDSDTELLRRRLRQAAWVNVSLTTVVCLLLAGLLATVWKLVKGPSQLQCAKLNSPWSPAWDGIEFWEGDFENEFPHKTKYRGPPTAERDQAWMELWIHDGITISEEGVHALNKTGRTWVRNESGTGYEASLEVFHQLHCLDLVRQYTWLHLYTEETTPMNLREPVGARMHVDHCIETLRLSLMCYADVTPLLAYVDPGSPLGSSADFNVHHQCRDFDRLVEYLLDTKGSSK